MFRTIRVALPADTSLVQTALAYKEACQIVLNCGSQHTIYGKNALHRATYRRVRESLPNLPSALVQTARDEASEILKRTGYAAATKRRLSVRCDKRTFKFYPDQDRVSLTTVRGRLSFSYNHYDYLDTWRGQYTNAQLLIRGNRALLNVQVEIIEPERKRSVNDKILGICRGVLNVAVCSDNTFFNSRQLRAVKGRYRYLRRILQHVGTRSAHRKLRKLSGRERRFVLNANHYISKAIVNKPFGVFALEMLRIRRRRTKSRGFNRLLGSWSPEELRRFIATKRRRQEKSSSRLTPEILLGFAHAVASFTNLIGVG
jgi:predicted transposase